jgi:hypothetical protein
MSESSKTKDDAVNAAEDAAAAKAAKKAQGSAPPAWQALDYDGPLDIEQAMWRNENLKKHGDYQMKPAEIQAKK